MSRRGPRGWLAVGAGLALAALVLWTAPKSALDWQPTRAWAEPWRPWSAAFVHWSAWHLGANLIGCTVVSAFGWTARVPPWAAWAWLLAWPLTHLALSAQPALASYGGLSGVLHAGVAVAAYALVREGPGRPRAIGLAVLLGLALKLALEAPWGAPTRAVPGWDFPVAPLAHLTGALAGLACAALFDAAWVRSSR